MRGSYLYLILNTALHITFGALNVKSSAIAEVRYYDGTRCFPEDLLSRRRWRQIQHLSGIFWKRWAHEYLPFLRNRQKWLYPCRNHVVGDIVLVAAENISRNSWPLGRIQQVFSRQEETRA